MGAIGGAVDFRNCNIDFSAFNNIRNAQTLRGRKGSVAYLDSGIAMFYNSDGFFESEQPILSERRGYNASLVIDSPFFDVALAMESYRAYGVEFVGMLDIPFAMALYDGERRMLLLARDKKGKKPLYYTVKAGRVFFSSEPKGVLSTKTNGVYVNGDMLSSHLTSPMGIYGAADIYADIFEVHRGECVLFTELGVSKFFYRENPHKKIAVKNRPKFLEKAIEPFFEFEESKTVSSLEDALIAFDMPQFDVYMPSICKLFEGVQNGLVFQFVDLSKRNNILFSYDREDRLSAFYGKIGIGVIGKFENNAVEKTDKEKELLLNFLIDTFFSLDRSAMLLLRKIFGDSKLNCFIRGLDKNKIKKEDTELIIRILGMMYQTAEWVKLRDIRFLSEEKGTFSI